MKPISLSTAKRDLLKNLLQREGLAPGGAGPGPIAPRDPAAPLSLSSAQQRMWFLDRLEPGHPLYVIDGAFRLTGPLSVPVLQKALTEIVRRHEAMRTLFPAVGGSPAPYVAPPCPVAVPVTDLSALPVEQREAEALRLAAAEGVRPFDLAAGPLFRFALLRLAPEEHLFVLSFHHVVADGWAFPIFFRELGALYGAFAAGQPSPLPDLPIQYGDFAAWQRQWLAGPELERQAAYWKERLSSGRLPVLELPSDRPRPPVPSHRGGQVRFRLEQPLLEQLQSLSRVEGATLFMTLLTAFAVLLYRYSGKYDLCVGTPIANRTRPETEDLIGVFINTLVIRTDLEGSPSFRKALHRVREACLGAYANQDLPFEKLVEILQPERATSHSPLFQVLFNLQVREGRSWEMPGLTVTQVPLPQAVAKFDLSLSMMQGGTGIDGVWEFSTDLFEPDTVQRMAGHYQRLLEGAVADISTPVDRLPLLTGAEAEQVLHEWNGTAMDLPLDRPVHLLFEEQAARTPDAIALQTDDARLTYAELNGRANRLAHRLRELGVGSDRLVAVMLNRTAELVVGLLAVLKAGGAYVPLDPAYPADRLAYMLEDSGAAVLLTGEPAAAGLPTFAGHTLCVGDWPAVGSEENPDSGAGPDNLAYVIYTSGSTGRPKGVQVEHRGLTNLLLWARQEPGMDGTAVVLTATSISFDIAALEIYLPLIAGARLVLVSREVAADGARLAARLDEVGATVLQATPATWRMLLAAGWRSRPGFRMQAGGEALPPDLARRLLEGGGELWNLYGPTETTIWSTACRVEQVEGQVAIGRPIANTQVYILDGQMQPVPVGVPGDLYIGGAGVARGYLNRPELTAERFVTTSWGRLYRTGDLARWQPDGNLAFLGRSDFQVKIRGYRIELGEIEAALEADPAVAQAVVTAREDGSGELGLVAYLVPAGGGGPGAGDVDVARLKEHLARSLPPFMIPAAWVTLQALPLTPNGKVDRKALPVPDTFARTAQTAFVAPASPVERSIAAAWASVLRVDRVGLHDSFFDLGGHSLLLVQVQARLQEELGREIPLLDLFHYPTVAALAAYLSPPGHRPEAPAIGAAARDRGAARRAMQEQRAARRPGAIRKEET